MTFDLSLIPIVFAYHNTGHGGGESSNLTLLFAVLGIFATAAWLIFSELSWRNTVAAAVAAWILGIGFVIVA